MLFRSPQDPFMSSQVQQSLPSPRTPRRIPRGPDQDFFPHSPSKAPSEQQLKALHEHIQAVYGSSGQVFINILPTPITTPQKPTPLASHRSLEMALMPTSFGNMSDINLEPSSRAMTFDLDNPEADMGYESSSYYTSDALSPSPLSSPDRKSTRLNSSHWE